MTPAHRPVRTCLGCRGQDDKDALVRYVMGPDGAIHVDLRHKLPGRGAYTCASRECLVQAVRRGGFQRAFRGRCQKADVDGLLGDLARQLMQRVDNLIGMLRKSGEIVGGGNAVTAALDKRESLQMVIAATDVSAGVLEKIRRKATACEVPIFKWGSKADLGRLTGREQRSVLGIRSCALAKALEDGLKRYEQFVGEI